MHAGRALTRNDRAQVADKQRHVPRVSGRQYSHPRLALLALDCSDQIARTIICAAHKATNP